MNYWLTTHWPPNQGSVEDFIIYLPHGRQQAGIDVAEGDLVLIYQSETGRSEIAEDVNGQRTVVHRTKGKRGIIAIAMITGRMKKTSDPTTLFADGSKICWCWRAPTKLISTNGYAPLEEVNRVLHYAPSFNLHGFGDYHSGLEKIEVDKFNELRDIFLRNPRKIEAIKKLKGKAPKVHRRGEEAESKEHLALKKFVASDPSKILGEKGLKTIAVEYPFPTGDRADIVLEDAMGRIIGVEIEVSADITQLEGFLQAIKYRYMLAPMFERLYNESRAFLIAYSIADDIKSVCDKYDVEYFVIDRKKVKIS